MEPTRGRILLVDPSEGREVLATRLRAQGYVVQTAADAARGAHMALAAPPSAVVADLWMPSISGVQLCILLRAEAATADVPVILRGDLDPRSRFWASRAGAAHYVTKGRMGDLLRVLETTVAEELEDSFFIELSGGEGGVRDRIARQLDATLFEAVMAGEVRALSTAGSFEQLFDRLSQFVSQILRYRWLAVAKTTTDQFAIHHPPSLHDAAEREARTALDVAPDTGALTVQDEDALDAEAGGPPVVRAIMFGNREIARIAVSPCAPLQHDDASIVALIARELGGPLRLTALVEESQRLASTDPLTGLMNRRAFTAALETELGRSGRHGYPLSLLLLDVDHFKRINDQRGHAAGDRVLAALGGLIRKISRREDLAARWGGEEFVIALPSTELDGGFAFAERLRSAIEGLVVESDGGDPIPVTASMGIAGLATDEPFAKLVERADHAMYESKSNGRNRTSLAA